MRRIAIFAVVVLFAVSSLSAAELGKFNDWSESPAAYYLTKAEREQWAKLTSESEAEAFVQKYNADRGGETFTKELNKRIAMADKYLTVGKTQGSRSMRGKVVILLGPPASMDVAAKKGRAAARTGSVSMATSLGGESGGTSMAAAADVAERSAMSSTSTGLSDYTFQYMAAALPTNQDLQVVVEVNVRSGEDRIADKKAAAALDQLFETVAQKSIVAK
jgi:GWxTD domain-containing protein